MTEDTEVTARFLARCAGEAAVSATPQLRLVLRTSLAATQRSSLQQQETGVFVCRGVNGFGKVTLNFEK